MFIQLDAASAVPLQDQIFRQVQNLCRQGQLQPGTQVPSSRTLAELLRVSRNTVSYAYDRLIAEGYFVTRTTAGTFVAATSTRAQPDERFARTPADVLSRIAPASNLRRPIMRPSEPLPVDFWSQRPDPRSFPLRSWRRLLNLHLSRAAHNLTEYGDPCGIPDFRDAVARFAHLQRGIACGASDVVAFGGKSPSEDIGRAGPHRNLPSGTVRRLSENRTSQQGGFFWCQFSAATGTMPANGNSRASSTRGSGRFVTEGKAAG